MEVTFTALSQVPIISPNTTQQSSEFAHNQEALTQGTGTKAPLRVVIDARLSGNAGAGGHLQTLVGLASGLSQLDADHEEYLFLVYPNEYEWLRPYLSGPCKALPAASPRKRRISNLLQTLSALGGPALVQLPEADETVRNAQPHAVHLMLASGFRSPWPAVYSPHDLQHRHLPEFFNWRTRRIRDVRQRALCRLAETVCVMTEWGRSDVIREYNLPAEKVAVIPWGPTQNVNAPPSREDVARCAQQLAIPADSFAFYPAKLYRHKNHIRLLEALAQLRDHRGIQIHLVLTGGGGSASDDVRAAIQALRLEQQVTHLGYVSEQTIACLYELCRCVILPSLFEGWCLPLTEALSAGKPVACSNRTCLPEVAGDAALLFDPYDVSAIAHALQCVWEDRVTRERLAAAGPQRVAEWSWKRTAEAYRDLYRRIARRGGALHP